jgi:GNAT superfamily N-acetyltransferase
MSEVITYQERFRTAYHDLNLEWIEKYFRAETKDLEQLNHPESCLNEGGQIFFIVDGEKAVGTCALYRTGPREFELAKMAVAPSHQGRGLGDDLMIAAERWAKAHGADSVLILSNTVLEPAIRLYHKHGYKTVQLGPHPDYERCNIMMRKSL